MLLYGVQELELDSTLCELNVGGIFPRSFAKGIEHTRWEFNKLMLVGLDELPAVKGRIGAGDAKGTPTGPFSARCQTCVREGEEWSAAWRVTSLRCESLENGRLTYM